MIAAKASTSQFRHLKLTMKTEGFFSGNHFEFAAHNRSVDPHFKACW